MLPRHLDYVMVVGLGMFSRLHQNTLTCVVSRHERNISAHSKDIEVVVHMLRVCAVYLRGLRHMIINCYFTRQRKRLGLDSLCGTYACL